jgi:hypothetical protein
MTISAQGTASLRGRRSEPKDRPRTAQGSTKRVVFTTQKKSPGQAKPDQGTRETIQLSWASTLLPAVCCRQVTHVGERALGRKSTATTCFVGPTR